MSKTKTDSIGYWKSAFVTLPDAIFFDIVRNYLGDVSTPFNKHKLLEKLVSFLKKPETARRITALIDMEDAQLLTAVRVLDAPSVDRLYAFLGGGESYLDLHHRLLNLEERLLVYRDHQEGEARVRINPILVESLESAVINPESVFPFEPCTPNSERPWFTESVVLGFITYACHSGNFLKADGSLRKKAAGELKNVIPPLVQARDRANRTVMLTRALERLGILIQDANAYSLCREELAAIAELDAYDRNLTYWSAASRSIGKGSTQQRVSCLRDLIEILNPERSHTPDTMWKILFSISGSNIVENREESDRFISVLEALGILYQPQKGMYSINRLDGVTREAGVVETNAIVQPNFEIRVEGGRDLRPLLILPIATEIRRSDIVSTYELTKESYVRALRDGFTSEMILTDLEALNGKPIPQNISVTCKSWGSEYDSVRLYSGIILAVDDTRRHLVEHGGFVDTWVREVLAPGVYLLDPAERESWERELINVGIEAVPSIRSSQSVPQSYISGGDDTRAQFPSPKRQAGSDKSLSTIDITTVHGAPSREKAVPPDQSFLEQIEKKATSLGPADREEMVARVKKKLILFPEQVRGGMAPKEKNEARGIDYSGKVRLIEQALRTGTELLEIIERSTIGDPEKRLLKPEGLDQKANDLELFGIELPSGKQHRVRVRKIALLRKLKGSLYAP